MRMRVPGLLSLLLMFSSSICISQTPTADATASIEGRVTIGGKGAAGITVAASLNNDSGIENRTVAKAVTDDEGHYRLTGLAAGRLTITPISKAFVVVANGSYGRPGQTVNVAEHESITKIDFTLVRGGVITGRVTDLDGRPIIGERVQVDGRSGESHVVSFLSGRKNQTDDRGVYRIYGLAPGTYRVSVGRAATDGGNIIGMGGSQYVKTFYPGVTEESKATTIEITAGSEATNIDITPGKADRGFAVSGRVVDAESGKPVAGVLISYAPVDAAGQLTEGRNYSSQATDAEGRFRVEGIKPGHYSASTMTIALDNTGYGEAVPFEVADADVTGIEIKVRPGVTIEGVAVIENNVDPAAAALLQSVSLFAYVNNATGTSGPSFGNGKINSDGSFRLAGLAPGRAWISVQGFPSQPKGLQLLRMELEGVEQPEGIEVTAGAHVTGVRLVFAYGTGKIRGEVRIEGGTLPEGTTFRLSFHEGAGDALRSGRSIEVDARGHFAAEDIPPGTYRLTLNPRANPPPFETVRRTITVANGAETQVILVVNLATRRGAPE